MTTIQTFQPNDNGPDILSKMNGNFDAINTDLEAAETDIVTLQSQVPIADASTTVKGPVKLSTSPASPTNPIAVGDNDPRVPTQGENDAMAGTYGTPSASNKFVTQTDTNLTNNVKLTGDETIAGVKTFSSIPVLPASNPTTDNQLVRKAYADSIIAETTGSVTDGGSTIYYKKRGNKFYYDLYYYSGSGVYQFFYGGRNNTGTTDFINTLNRLCTLLGITRSTQTTLEVEIETGYSSSQVNSAAYVSGAWTNTYDAGYYQGTDMMTILTSITAV